MEHSTGVPSATRGARFDWYAATVHTDEDDLLGRLSAGLGARVDVGQAMHGYDRGYELHDVDDERRTVARVLAGGRNGNPHVWASGEETGPLVREVRDAWPAMHRVTRVDSALDYDEVGCFDQLLEVCVAKADQRRLRIDQKGDWQRQDSPAGRTLYVGSTTSPSMVRLYEKGKQVRGLGGPGAGDVSTDWVRLEMQLRPMRHAKQVAASVDPLDVWGFSRWTRELLGEVEGYYPERVDMNPPRETDDERAFRFMVKQYAGVLGRLKGSGTWADVGEMIGRRVLLDASENGIEDDGRARSEKSGAGS